MSWCGNCYGNAVAESFFHLLKTERVKRKISETRKEARKDVFDYIELFYNPNADMLITGCYHPSNLRWKKNEVARGLKKLMHIRVIY